MCHGRPTGRAEGPPEDRIPAGHPRLFPPTRCKFMGARARPEHDTRVNTSDFRYYTAAVSASYSYSQSYRARILSAANSRSIYAAAPSGFPSAGL